ncbi:MAG: protein kinase [Myxococcales bacterium]|nr:protein kinase [Myxococcales bacterium]
MSSTPDLYGGAQALVVPGFELIGELGRGGMGVVHLARDEQLGRFVAVKVLTAGRLAHASAAERLRREAKALSQLSHPGIVTVYAFAMTPHGPCIVMEYVSGASLGTVLEGGPIDTSAWIELLAQAADALDTAHRAGVVHRDVKPSNLLVVRDGTRQTLKVIDFGLVSFSVDAPDRLTRAGAYVGTPSYASPEQALGHAVDGRADVYSLAVVALEGLTMARLTRTGVEPGAELSQALDRPSALSPDVERVFVRALAFRPEDRPPTPSAFVSALRSALQLDAPERALTPPQRVLQSASGFHAVLRVELPESRIGDVAGGERACLDAIALAVERAHGAIASVVEGAIVAVFGAATGTLHPAEQALRAGFEARARLTAASNGVRPRVAVAGAFTRIDASRARLLSATGPAFAEARVLCSQDADALIITPAVYARARGLVSGILLPGADLPGDALAVEPSGVERDLGEPDFYGVPIPFVGRDAELTELLAHVDDVALRREAGVFVVEAEQGLGRTRLLRELATALATRAQLYLLEFVRLAGDDGLEEGLLRSLRSRAGIGPNDTETAVRLKLDFALRRAGVALGSGDDVLLDGLSALLRRRDGAAAETRADGFVTTLAAYWRKLAEAGPLVVLVDDLHLGGRDASLVLERLVLGVRESPVAVVVSRLLRPESDASPTRALRRLRPLAAHSARALVGALLARAGSSPLPLLESVVSVAAGVPARLEQCLHDLVDRGVLTPGPRDWAVDLDRAADDLADETQRRLDGLTPLARRTLEAAALAGDPCWREQLDAMLEAPADVQGLVDHSLLRLSGDARLPGAQALELATPGLRDAILAGLPIGARRALHESAARFLSDRLATLGLSMVATLVRHLDGAGLPEDALRATIRGAERAAKANQPAKAVALYDRALDLSKRLGHDADDLVTPWLTQLLLAGDLPRLAHVTESLQPSESDRLLLRGRALERLGRFESAEAAYHDAALLAGGATRRRAQVAEAALASKRGAEDVLARLEGLAADESGDESADSEAHRQLGNALLRAGRFDDGERALARAADLAESADDVAAELEAQNALAAAAYYRGELALAQRRFGAALRLAERGHMVQHEALINNNLAELQLALGELRAASASAAKALALYRALGSDEGVADAARIASACARARGDDGRALSEESLAAARRTGVERLVSAAEAQLAASSG